MVGKVFRTVALGLVVTLLSIQPVFSQDDTGCSITQAAHGPARQVFTCGSTLVFEREPAAALRIGKRRDNPVPRTIEVQGGAILIDVEPGSPPTRIRTPNAIATVRGTTYIVDAAPEQTSVFVIDGTVRVTETDGSGQVTLGPGEGVDVAPGAPLEVRVWGIARVNALLGRFGR